MAAILNFSNPMEGKFGESSVLNSGHIQVSKFKRVRIINDVTIYLFLASWNIRIYIFNDFR